MGKKAIFIHAELTFWIEVAAKLHDTYDWDILYFVGRGEHKEKTLTLFPRAIYHTNGDAIKNKAPEGCESFLSTPLDSQLLSALSCHESIFMKMMDRFNYNGSFTYLERIFTYHSQVIYWKGVLDHFSPDVVAFRTAPHWGFDYTLYALCKILDIPTVMFERTCLPGFAYPVRTFEEGSEIIRNAYARAIEASEVQEISLTPDTAAHFENLSASYNQAMPFHEKFKSKHYMNEGEVGNVLSILWLVLKSLVKGVLKKKDLTHLRKRYHKNMGRFKKKKLLTHYQTLAKTVDLSKPYVFVALQCEPERQTCPVGGMFGNQYVMIDLLSKIVPSDWKIYVKEHRSQFKTYQAVERAKTNQYYNKIASMPNVELLPLTHTSFELIDNAKASATVSGTVGWESVVRGRPALLFGHSWYMDCEGVFRISTVEDGKGAIRKLLNGYKVNAHKVKCFAQIVERYSVKSYTDKVYEKMKTVPHQTNVENLARAIYEFVSLKSQKSKRRHIHNKDRLKFSNTILSKDSSNLSAETPIDLASEIDL